MNLLHHHVDTIKAEATRRQNQYALGYPSTADERWATVSFYGPALEVGTNYPAARRVALEYAISDAWQELPYLWTKADDHNKVVDLVKRQIAYTLYLDDNFALDPRAVY